MHVLIREPGVYGGGDMHQLRLRAVGVAAGLALAAGALFFGPIQSAASSWSIVSSPNSGTGGNGLVGVACASSNSCTAVGNYANSSGTSQTLIESWNGSGWSIVPSPNIGTHVNYLDAVACISSSSCTAVGAYIYDRRGELRLVRLLHRRGLVLQEQQRGSDPDRGLERQQLVDCVQPQHCGERQLPQRRVVYLVQVLYSRRQ